MRTFLIFILLLLIIPTFLYPDTINVPADYPSIQEAIDAALNGDTVLVYPGTYVENIDFIGKAITVKSSNGAETTIIDGGQFSSVVTFVGNEDVGSVLEGFTITNGFAYHGGGVYCNNHSSPIIRNNTISGNTTTDDGSGIYCWNSSSPKIMNNIISGNTAYGNGSGGGIYCDLYSSPEITRNMIMGNTSTFSGGGIYCGDSFSSTITENTIMNNTAPRGAGISFGFFSAAEVSNNLITGNNASFGGGVYCYAASPSIASNTIRDNSASEQGGGIFLHYESDPQITDNHITGNTADNEGGGIYCDDNSAPIIMNNTIMENSSLYGFGGGIYCSESSPLITNNLIADNRADMGGGGGISCGSSSSLAITNNKVTENSASSGGGIDCKESSPLITNNIVAGNQADHNGGGLFLSGQASPIVTNNVITANLTDSRGGGICCIQSCTPAIANTICRDNAAPDGPEMWIGDILNPSTLSISHSNVKGAQSLIHVEPGCTLTWGDGMIDADPLFADADNNDFHLTFNSPCRDTGDNSAITELFDFEGDPRIAWGGTVDMGGDEFYTHLYVTGDATPNGKVEAKFVGLPGTTPVGLWLGSGALDPPLKSMFGSWYLEPPWIGPVALGPIPSPEGVLILPATIHREPPPPYDLFMQALIGLNPDSLTNLCVLEVR